MVLRLGSTLTSDLQSHDSYCQGQKSVGSKYRVEIDKCTAGQTGGQKQLHYLPC